jgi:hypothetical protein
MQNYLQGGDQDITAFLPLVSSAFGPVHRQMQQELQTRLSGMCTLSLGDGKSSITKKSVFAWQFWGGLGFESHLIHLAMWAERQMGKICKSYHCVQPYITPMNAACMHAQQKTDVTAVWTLHERRYGCNLLVQRGASATETYCFTGYMMSILAY